MNVNKLQGEDIIKMKIQLAKNIRLFLCWKITIFEEKSINTQYQNNQGVLHEFICFPLRSNGFWCSETSPRRESSIDLEMFKSCLRLNKFLS